MPKSKINSRPDNRRQKAAAQRSKKVATAASKALGKAAYSGVGPGRMHNSQGKAAQATRTLAMEVDKRRARKIAPKRGR
jgi:hypothetical protein